MAERKLWFKAKWYGWGWYPASWEGWLVLLVCLGIGLPPILFLEQPATHELLAAFLWFAAWMSLLIYICYRTGEKPRWRWGK
jgi:hypothetical protein